MNCILQGEFLHTCSPNWFSVPSKATTRQCLTWRPPGKLKFLFIQRHLSKWRFCNSEFISLYEWIKDLSSGRLLERSRRNCSCVCYEFLLRLLLPNRRAAIAHEQVAMLCRTWKSAVPYLTLKAIWWCGYEIGLAQVQKNFPRAFQKHSLDILTSTGSVALEVFLRWVSSLALGRRALLGQVSQGASRRRRNPGARCVMCPTLALSVAFHKIIQFSWLFHEIWLAIFSQLNWIIENAHSGWLPVGFRGSR